MENTKTLIRAAQLAHHLNCGKSTVYKLAETGQIPIVKIGRTGVRFDLSSVMAALQRPMSSTSEQAR